MQTSPLVPHAWSDIPAWQLPAMQQPLHPEHVTVAHPPALQPMPIAVQFWQMLPPIPHMSPASPATH